MKLIPPKLKSGDEIRCVAPAMSLEIVKVVNRRIANRRLEELGFKVTFGKHVNEYNDFESSSVKSRVTDLHEAFADPKVKGILCIEGGFNSNQLLQYLDWDLIRSHPKVLCGYSDITALNNAFFAKTGLVTYSGPLYSSFAQKKGFEYTLEYFQKCVMSKEPYKIEPSSYWIDDNWEKDQDNVHFKKNKGPITVYPGEAQGTIVGANLSTLNLLQGTEYMPSLENTVLFLEDDYEYKPHHFDRAFQSLIHQPDFKGVKGIVWGRPEGDSKMTDKLMIQILKTKKELKNMPVVINADFGHTSPKFTYPIGGTAKIVVRSGKVCLEILEH